jgi:hypothetical protein
MWTILFVEIQDIASGRISRLVRHSSGLVSASERGISGRLERVSARLNADFLGRGTGTTEAARRSTASGDDAGHAIARRLGGSGGASFDNIFSQLSSLNRGRFARFEARVARWVRAGDDVEVDVRFMFTDPSAPDRPTHIVYGVMRNGRQSGRVFRQK